MYVAKIVLVVFFFITAVNSDAQDDEDTAMCIKYIKKFTLTRVCAQQNLAVKCLNIETPYITQVLDYCYKELNYDPINIYDTLQYICSYEETVTEAADCLCKAEVIAEYDDEEFLDAMESELSENEEYEPRPYDSSMWACFDHMNSIYHKYKRRL